MWDYLPGAQVFSAHAEVVPSNPAAGVKAGGILRARGGSSDSHSDGKTFPMYSPRTRR